MIDKFIRARALLSVSINGLWIGYNNLPTAVRRFCAPAFFHNEGEPTFDLTTRGSAILLRFQGRNFAVLTHHQLGKGVHTLEAKDFTIGIDDRDGRKVGLTPVAVTRVSAESYAAKNLEDLQICEYEDVWNGRDLTDRFLKLDLSHTLETVPSDAIKGIFAIGFPSELTAVEIGEWDEDTGDPPMSMRFQWVKVHLQPAAATHPFDPDNRIILEPDPKAPTTLSNPDGLSGAPVFFVWQDNNNQAWLGLAGMVTNARIDRFAVYSTIYIRTALQQHVDAAAVE
ncbi:hypothetical protein [Brevundimonas naejangsanensis]